MKKNILIILGHPRSDSLCGALTESYKAGAIASGYHVETIKLGDYSHINRNLIEKVNTGEYEETEWNIRRDQLKKSDHIVFIFPTWRYSVPAILKGWFDRMLIPRFSHQYTGYLKRKKLLDGKTASMFTTCGGPRWVYWLKGGHDGFSWLKNTCNFVGIKPVYKHYFTKIAPGLRSESEIHTMIQTMYDLGYCGK